MEIEDLPKMAAPERYGFNKKKSFRNVNRKVREK